MQGTEAVYIRVELFSPRNCSCVYTCRLVFRMYTASVPPDIVLECALEIPKCACRNAPLPTIGLTKIISFIRQTFSQEVHEQEPKMEAVVQAGRSGLLEVQWPLRTPGGRGLDR